MSLKLCPGDHHHAAPCVTCDEDKKRCDLCWEENPDDQHDDLRDFRVWPDDRDSQVMRLCKSCWERAQRRGKYSDEERGDRWES